MADNSKKISELPIIANVASADRVLVLRNPASNAYVATVTVNNIINSVFSSFQTDLIPVNNGVYNLGNSSHQWKSLYVTGNTIYLGGTALSVDTNGTLLINNSTISSNIAFTQYNAPWEQTYPVITTKVDKDLNILGNNAPVNISSNQYTQLVYSQDGSPYGGGNNQSYTWVASGYNGDYIQSSDPEFGIGYWVEHDLYANGMLQHYGWFDDNEYNFSYGWSISPSRERYGYGIDIQPSDVYGNIKLTIEPTGDYDIHLYESGSNGAVTLGRYGATNFRVYGPGGANNGGGQYGNDIRAELAANSSFLIKTYDTQDHSWSFNPDGSLTGDLIPVSDNTYSLGNTTNQWKSLHVSGNTIFIDNVPLAASKGSITANTFTATQFYDELRRPIFNLNALDINADCGSSSAIYSPSDPKFDGGATSTIFGAYEAALDGGASFNNIHSASFIDGGGAAQL